MRRSNPTHLLESFFNFCRWQCGWDSGLSAGFRKDESAGQVTESVGEMPIPIELPVERQMLGRCCSRDTLIVDQFIEKTTSATCDERECRHPLD